MEYVIPTLQQPSVNRFEKKKAGSGKRKKSEARKSRAFVVRMSRASEFQSCLESCQLHQDILLQYTDAPTIKYSHYTVPH